MECLFGMYNSIMENVYARNIDTSRMSGFASAKEEQLQNSYQSC